VNARAKEWQRSSAIAVFLFAVVTLGIAYATTAGQGHDFFDSYGYQQVFIRLIEEGQYRPSRFYGHPLAELIIGFLSYFFGSAMTDSVTYVAFVGSVAFFFRACFPRVSFFSDWRFIGLTAMCVSNPVLFFNNTIPMDFSWALLFLSIGLYFLSRGRFELSCLAFGLAIACRANFALFAYTLILSYAYVRRATTKCERTITLLALTSFCGGVFYLTVFFQSHLSLSFISNSGGPELTLGQLMPRFTYKLWEAFGVFSFFIVLWGSIELFRLRGGTRTERSVLLSVGPLVLVNLGVFFGMPTKLAILEPAIVATYVLLSSLNRKWLFIGVFVLNMGSWFVSFDLLDIQYRYSDPCKEVQAVSVRLSPHFTAGEYYKTRERAKYIWCVSGAFGDRKEAYEAGRPLRRRS